jgi:hypothetical protein
MAPSALEQAYTTRSGVGLIAIELKGGKIEYQSPSFHDLFSWIPLEARGNIRVSLESRDGDTFHSFCQRVVRDAGEPYGDTFLDLDQVLERSITVRFFTRAPGPPGLQNPEWLLMVRAVKLTLVGAQPRRLAGELPAAGRRLPFWGQGTMPEAIGVFTADLSGGTPQQWTLQVAHARYLLDLEVASGTYSIEVGDMKVLELMATMYNFEFSKKEGTGASLFSRAAQLGTSTLNVAQSAASWLTQKALTYTKQWMVRLDDDDAVSISSTDFFQLFGSWSTSLSMDFVVGKFAFSHGGLAALYFVADPAQPLDGNLHVTWIRIPSAKTGGKFDVQQPFVVSSSWGCENCYLFCTKMAIDMRGKKMPAEEDVSQLFETLKVSPGGVISSDGTVTLCLGESDGQPSSIPDDL